jgi:hypothetical protein
MKQEGDFEKAARRQATRDVEKAQRMDRDAKIHLSFYTERLTTNLSPAEVILELEKELARAVGRTDAIVDMISAVKQSSRDQVAAMVVELESLRDLSDMIRFRLDGLSIKKALPVTMLDDI